MVYDQPSRLIPLKGNSEKSVEHNWGVTYLQRWLLGRICECCLRGSTQNGHRSPEEAPQAKKCSCWPLKVRSFHTKGVRTNKYAQNVFHRYMLPNLTFIKSYPKTLIGQQLCSSWQNQFYFLKEYDLPLWPSKQSVKDTIESL